MTIKIYHNPLCSKSRQTLQLLEAKGINPEIILYLETPPTIQQLEAILNMLNMSDPRDLMRKNEIAYTTLDLAKIDKTRVELMQAMVENPILIERPIVVNQNQAKIGRPPENILGLFPE